MGQKGSTCRSLSQPPALLPHNSISTVVGVTMQLCIPRSHFSQQHNLMSHGGCCHVNSGTLIAQVSSQRQAVLSSSRSSQHHGSQSEKRSVQKVCQAVVPPSVLLLKPAACLSAAAVSARPRLFLRPCCSTTSNCAHRQITLQGGEEGRGWSLNTH